MWAKSGTAFPAVSSFLRRSEAASSHGHQTTSHTVFSPPHRWKLRFIESDFKGQLPKEYSPHRNATWVIPEHMNDMNREEPSRYVSVYIPGIYSGHIHSYIYIYTVPSGRLSPAS